MKWIPLLIALMIFSSYLSADGNGNPETYTLLELEKLELQKLNLDATVWGLLQNGLTSKKFNCLKAVPNEKICSCLSEKLPAILSFTGYVQILSKNKLEHSYATLSSDDRELINKVRSVRDECAIGN